MHAALTLLCTLLPALATALPQQLAQLTFRPSSTRNEHRGESLVRVQWHARPEDAVRQSLGARYDVWSATPDHLDLRVGSGLEEEGQLLDLLGENGNITTLHEDLAPLLELKAHQPPPDDEIHTSYHPLEGIHSLLHLFAADHSPHAKVIEIGKSFEGRPILGLDVSRKPRGKQAKKRKAKATILVVGGQHAREWITPAATLYMAHALLLEASQSRVPKRIRHLLDAFDFVFIPTLNPDGYEYSWTEDRLWRKSRQPVGEGCDGIELNRNWGYHWSADAYGDPCSDSYPGNSSFAAVETRALEHFIKHAEHKVVALLDMHSFGEMIMYPYAYECKRVPSRAEDLIEAGYGAARAAKMQHGVSYSVGSVCETSYPSSGELVDWAYGEQHIKWTYSVNLRDSGIHGFLLPAVQIRPTGEEALAMMLSIADFIRVKEKR